MEKELSVYNPANGDLVGILPMLDEKEFQTVIQRALDARKAWSQTSIYDRSRMMELFMELVEQHVEEIGQILTKEMGKPIVQARAELMAAIDITRSFVQRANHLYGEVLNADNQPGYERDLIFTRREPLGMIACIIPFNYPVKLMIHKVVPALLMGNVVLAKVPSDNPLAVSKVGELFRQAGFPEGVIQCFGCSRELSNQYLIENPDIQAVSLTGSTRVGIQMSKAGADTLKHMFMELGGNDGTIIRQDADLDFAVEEIAQGRMVNAGQTCCACSPRSPRSAGGKVAFDSPRSARDEGGFGSARGAGGRSRFREPRKREGRRRLRAGDGPSPPGPESRSGALSQKLGTKRRRLGGRRFLCSKELSCSKTCMPRFPRWTPIWPA